MKALDLAIIFGYLIGIVLFGAWFGRKQKTTRDYFLGDRSVPWWAVAFSIVATETSTITFISVPGIAFSRGGNYQFLQLVFGYMLGRIVIAILFIPSYFRGELMTVYQLLDRRFGGKIKMLAASLFVVMRNIADGIRLLLTAIVLAAVYTSFQPAANAETIVVASIILIGVAMIVFTYFGGMEAVIWVEVVQLGIYIVGALAAAIILTQSIDGGLSGALALGSQFNKFSLFDFSFDMTKTFTFWAGLIGGCFLTMSTHGTDQYLVQRYLCTDRPRRRRRRCSRAARSSSPSSSDSSSSACCSLLFIIRTRIPVTPPRPRPRFRSRAAIGSFPISSRAICQPDCRVWWLRQSSPPPCRLH